MPELSIIHIGIATAAALIGIVVGWLVRSKLARQEKNAINSGWKEQIESQRVEHGRLIDQNKSLMEQVNQFKASSKDATNRAKELSEALKEAFARRDELQREIKDVRGNLESLLAERKRLQSGGATDGNADDDGEMHDKIFRLSRELENWQNRLPPLIEKFRERDADAKRLEDELADARATIEDLESRLSFDQTLVEPAATAPEDLDASNETIVETLVEPIGELADESSDESTDEPADEPADETVDETVNGTLSETLAETMSERLDGTLAETMAETSVETIIEPEVRADAASGNGVDHLPDDYDPVDYGPGDEHPDDDRLDDRPDDSEEGTSTLRDDLQMIKGVGPAIEKTLNELGIFRYGQIAGMSEYDIDRIAKRLKGFRSRIYREDWIGQARTLDDQRAGSL